MNTALVWGLLAIVSLPTGQGWSLGLDLEVDSSLRKDSEFPAGRNSGPYLKDSFRRDVLVPTLGRMVGAIQRNGANDAEVEISLLAMIGVIGLMGGYCIFKIKMELKELSRRRDGESGTPKDFIKIVPGSEMKVSEKGSFKMEFPGV